MRSHTARHTLAERLRAAAVASQTEAQPVTQPDSEDDAQEACAGRVKFLEAEVSNLRAERDTLSAHIRASDADLASGDAKLRWKIQWLTEKLENVELASRDRQRAMEEEMKLLRARHRDGLLRVRELEEQLNRMELPAVARSRADRRSNLRGTSRAVHEGTLWHSDPRQGKLQRDLESLRIKVEQLLIAVAHDTSADSKMLEEIEQERRGLLEELLDVEQHLKEKRRNEEKEATRRRAKNAKLRADVQRGRDELEGRVTPTGSTVVVELESNILQLSDDLRQAEEDLRAAEYDKAALGDELAALESDRQAVTDELAATRARLDELERKTVEREASRTRG